MNLIKSLFTGAVLMAAAVVSLAEQPMPLPLGRDISASFTGTAHRNDLVIPETMGGVPQTNVITFEPGSRSGWHTHGAMTVIGISGLGLYQAWGQPAVLVRPGDVIHIPAGVSHWHGATKNSRFQQFVVYDKTWKAPAGLEVHKGKITDAEYRRTASSSRIRRRLRRRITTQDPFRKRRFSRKRTRRSPPSGLTSCSRTALTAPGIAISRAKS